MKKHAKTKAQLLEEVQVLRQRVAELETAAREHTRTVEILRKNTERYRVLVENAMDFICLIDKDNQVLSLNKAGIRLLGKEPEDIIGKSIFEIFPKDIAESYAKNLKNVFTKGEPTISESKMIVGGKESWNSVSLTPVRDQEGNVTAVIGVTRDITERKHAERRQQLSAQLLSLLNSSEEQAGIIRKILFLIKQFSGIEAIGIRLREGGDFPYYETNGFSEDFMDAERYLCARNQHGKIIRDTEGKPFLEGMCGNIIYGRIDPALPFFTKGGSFWTNSTTEFLASTTEEDRQTCTRNRCHEVGYESVALIPLRSDTEIIGILQLNDHRKNMFTYEIIHFFEEIGIILGIAITRGYTQEKLLELQKAFETMHLGVTIIDLDRRILYTNPADAAMHGYTVEELIGQEAGIFAPAELRQPMTLEQIEETKNWVRESINIRKDGNRFPVQLISDVVRDADGRPIAIVTTCEDITERKRAEEKITASEKRYRLLIQNIHAGFVVHAPDTRILFNNRNASKLLGLTEEQMLGKTAIDPEWHFIEEDNTPLPLERYPVNQVISTLQPVEDLVVGIHRPVTNDLVWVLVNAYPVFDDKKRLDHITVTFIDITEQKRMLEELRQARDLLEQRVAERTAELTLLNEELERASSLKDEFLANMSHELRTPLNAILGYTQILKTSRNLNENQVKKLDTIKNSGEHLLSMINDILDLSKIEAGQMELQADELHLPNLLQSITDMILVRAEQKGVSFVYEHTADLPVGVYADEKRLGEVLMNLLGNAVKFTDQGSVTFRVKRIGSRGAGEMGSRGDREIGSRGDKEFGSASPHLPIPPSPYLPITPSPYLPIPPSPYLPISLSPRLRFEIEDTGIGIAPEHLDEIFLPFRQMRNNYQLTDGTGLGLAISQKLVEMMGGELKVKSTPGKGSLFWFELELSEVPGFVQKIEPPPPKILGYKGKRRIVMIVDDVQENRTVLTDMLLPLGFKIAEAENGQECFEKSRKFMPDVILLDLVMPGIKGFEVARRIRELETGDSILETGIEPSTDQHPASSIQHPVIIAISANAFKEIQRESLEAGCDDFLAKPFQKDDLLELLRCHLHLEWIYEKEAEARTGDDGSLPSSAETVTLLPSEEREKLLQQAIRGNVKGILKQLDTIERLGEPFLPLITELRTLAKSFQVDQIVELLEEEEAE